MFPIKITTDKAIAIFATRDIFNVINVSLGFCTTEYGYMLIEMIATPIVIICNISFCQVQPTRHDISWRKINTPGIISHKTMRSRHSKK